MKRRLGDAILDIASGPFGSSLKVECFVPTGFPIIDGANLKGIRVTDNITKFVTEAKARSLHRAIAKRHDVIVTISGSLGQVSFIPLDSKYPEYLCSQRQFRATFDERKVNVEYLVNVLRSEYGQRKILAFANYVGVPALSQPLPNFKNIELDLPSIEIQNQIANFVGSIDRLIQLSRKRIENLEKLAKEIYDYWFVQFDFPDKNGKPYKSSGGKMVYNPQLKREIPEGWEVKRLEEIAEYASDKVSSDDLTVECYVTTDSLCSGKKGREKATNLPPARCSLTAYLPYDTLVANIRPYLHKIWLADSDGGASNDVLVFRAKQKTAIGFLHELLWQDAFFDYVMSGSKGSKMPRGDKHHVMRYVFASPSDRILDLFNQFCIPVFDSRSHIEKQIHELIQLREFLLPLLMNGQAKMSLKQQNREAI